MAHGTGWMNIDAEMPRLMGLEQELVPTANFSVNEEECTKDSGVTYLGVEAFEALGYIAHQEGSDFWLDNGMSVGSDVEQLEVRTGEEWGPINLTIAREASLDVAGKIGETIGLGLFDVAGNYFDFSYEQRGYQTSMMAREGEYLSRVVSLLDSYTATAQWTGAGALTPGGFEYFQKTEEQVDKGRSKEEMHRIWDSSAQYDSDIMNEGWVRIEGRVADANRSGIVNYVDAAVRSLIVRLAALTYDLHSIEFESCTVKDPTIVRVFASSDLGAQETYECLDGKYRKAIDIQRIFYNRLKLLIREYPTIPKEEKDAVMLFGRELQRFAEARPIKRNVDSAKGSQHWAYHLATLLRRDERAPTKWHADIDKKLNTRSLAIARVASETPDIPDVAKNPLAGFARYTARGIYTPEQLAYRVHQPGNTRAAARASYLRDKSRQITSVTWNSIYYSDGRGEEYEVILDPTQTYHIENR